MSIEVGEIKIFMLVSGLEIIGKVEEVTDDYCKVKNAYAMQYHPQMNEQGQPVGIQINMSPLSVMVQKESRTGAADIDRLYFSSILKPIDPPEELSAQYSVQTGSVIQPSNKKIQMPVK